MKWKNTWVCNCGAKNVEKLPTDKKKLTCSTCGNIYVVRSMHIDGTPMLSLIGRKAREGTHES